MSHQIEKIASLEREGVIKNNQVLEFKERVEKAAEEFKVLQFKLQDAQKITTE